MPKLTLSKFWASWCVAGLLASLLVLKGGKTPGTFFLWATLGLAFSLTVALRRPGPYWNQANRFAAVGSLILLFSFWFSVERSASLYPTVQGLTWILIGMALGSEAGWLREEKIFWRTLYTLGAATAILTITQLSRGEGPSGLYEASGFMPANPIFNAIWLTSLSAAFFARALSPAPVHSIERGTAAALGLMLSLLVLLNPARTRGALVGLAVAAIYLLVVKIGIKRVAWAGAAALLSLVIVPKRLLHEHLYQIGRLGEANYRTQIWKVAVGAASDRPLTGNGLGTFEAAYQRRAFPIESDFTRYSRTTEFAHNEYLQAAADLGWPAAILLIAILLRLLRRSTRTFSILQVPAKAALLPLFVVALFNPIWHVPFLILLTLLWSLRLIQPEGEKSTVRLGASLMARRRAIAVTTHASLWLLLSFCAARSIWARNGDWLDIIRMNPNDAEAWHQRGRQLPPGPEALSALQHAVTLSPKNPFYREALANLLESAPFPTALDAARGHYEKALAYAPRRPMNALAIGRIDFRQGHLEAALTAFTRAIELEPNYWEAYFWIARCYRAMGLQQKAIASLTGLMERRSRFVAAQQKEIRRYRHYVPSDYERVILAFDAKYVQEQLRDWRRSDRRRRLTPLG